ncbi:LysR family transcriptional regulator (plasmid) [Paraburkholderia sp. PREW-6R]|uniref:LysR family transcriptional regulator n=1 Tax=Paraburkholderia sp. PREW-6R TaxID=3141544 RepID=UPI0031F59294
MDLDSLSDFVLVATHGGIAQASRVSGRPKASLSRKVMELEASLGVRLFERGSRSIQLTDEGEVLYTRATGPLSEISEVTELLRDGRAKPRGRLRINVPQVFGQLLVGRLAADFTIAYPEVALEITMEDREVDLVAEGYDVVIRINPKPDVTLVGRCFVRDQVLIVAAPSLPAPSMTSITQEEKPLPVILRTSVRNAASAIWRIPAPDGPEVRTRSVLQLPSLPIIRDAALTGIGAARLPRILVAEDLKTGRLVSWGRAVDHPSELWALHTSSRLVNAKVKAFMRFLEVAFPNDWL